MAVLLLRPGGPWLGYVKEAGLESVLSRPGGLGFA
jgi:hypothetical protein